MRLDTLTLHNFKNIAQATLEFSPGINCLLGDNGMGKTNLLDAIYFLSYTRSMSGQSDSALLSPGAPFMLLEGSYTRRGATEKLSAGMVPGRRKSIKRGGKEYTRLSDHIGLFPLVMSAPADHELIAGAAEVRRRMMDMMIAQGDPRYLDALIRYNAALQQRNRMLQERVVDHNLFAAVELPMAAAAACIHRGRLRWLQEFVPVMQRYHAAIAGEGAPQPTLTLQAHLAASGGDLLPLLDNARRHDEALGHTGVGPHRDDLVIELGGLEARRAASQGQCKTLTVALRLAQHEFLQRATGITPLLLLDDIFDKLDDGRVARIIDIVSGRSGNPERGTENEVRGAGDEVRGTGNEERGTGNEGRGTENEVRGVESGVQFGQIFITDTDTRHLDGIIAPLGADMRRWQVVDGRFTPLITS